MNKERCPYCHKVYLKNQKPLHLKYCYRYSRLLKANKLNPDGTIITNKPKAKDNANSKRNKTKLKNKV